MVDFNYQPFVQLAQDLIRDFGRDVELIRLGSTLRDANRPEKEHYPCPVLL